MHQKWDLKGKGGGVQTAPPQRIMVFKYLSRKSRVKPSYVSAFLD